MEPSATTRVQAMPSSMAHNVLLVRPGIRSVCYVVSDWCASEKYFITQRRLSASGVT
jgi:hypothetical protein